MPVPCCRNFTPHAHCIHYALRHVRTPEYCSRSCGRAEGCACCRALRLPHLVAPVMLCILQRLQDGCDANHLSSTPQSNELLHAVSHTPSHTLHTSSATRLALQCRAAAVVAPYTFNLQQQSSFLLLRTPDFASLTCSPQTSLSVKIPDLGVSQRELPGRSTIASLPTPALVGTYANHQSFS